MRSSIRRLLTAVLFVAASGAGAAAAQQTDRERMQEAERRAQEARAELERAVRLLQEEQGRDAERALRQSVAELQRALRELDRNRLAIRFATVPEVGGVSIFSGFGGPRMGVYLSTERDPAIDSIGVEISSVVDDGPAAEAGLRAGDIITRANGESLARTSRRGVSPANKLIEIKDELEVGDTLHVQYRRGSEARAADVILDDEGGFAWRNTWPDEERVVVAPRVDFEPTRIAVHVPEVFSGFPLGWLGVELVTLDEDLGRYFGTDEGLLVIRASEEGDLDLRSGDVILNVDGRVPTSQSHLVRIMRSYGEGEPMNIEIMRDHTRQTITVDVPDETTVFRRQREREF